MSSYEERVGEPQPIDKEYVDVIRSEVEVDRRYVDGDGLPTKIVYYSKEEKKLISKPKRVGKKIQFKNPEGNDVLAFGTERSVGNYYRIPELRAKEAALKAAESQK